MQGRWTIYVCPVCGHAGGADECAGPRDHHELISRPAVSVVPCDDAAIERVAFMLWRLRVDCRNLKLEDDRAQLRGFARSLLEAAVGETP